MASVPPRGSSRRWPLLAGWAVLAVALCACGEMDGLPPAAPASFSGAFFQSVPSASGMMRVAVRWSPAVPAVGVDAGELTVTDRTGTPIAGLVLSIVPWMPAHGHGTSVKPAISETAPGVFVATPLYLYMSGHWELRTTIGGADLDTAIPSVDLL